MLEHRVDAAALNCRQGLKNVKRVVVKLGSSSVTEKKGGVDLKKLRRYARDVAFIKKSGIELILVCSGAIHTARGLLSETDSAADLKTQQAYSSIGQPVLMEAWRKTLADFDLLPAQVLLTHEDFRGKKHYLNARNTLNHLLKNPSVVPVLNENDSLSFAEIALGDNDQLAAMVAEMLEADALLLLTTPDGVFSEDPSRVDGNDSSEAVRITRAPFGQTSLKISTRGRSASGRGGMKTKLQAIRRLTPLGTPVVVSAYDRDQPLIRALSEEVGTIFEGAGDQAIARKAKRKNRLQARVRSGCFVRADQGARDALLKGASLLPAGIRDAQGPFRRGDCVEVRYGRQILAVGLIEYDFADVLKLRGAKANEILNRLGQCPSKVIIHRNNMVLK